MSKLFFNKFKIALTKCEQNLLLLQEWKSWDKVPKVDVPAGHFLHDNEDSFAWK